MCARRVAAQSGLWERLTAAPHHGPAWKPPRLSRVQLQDQRQTLCRRLQGLGKGHYPTTATVLMAGERCRTFPEPSLEAAWSPVGQPSGRFKSLLLAPSTTSSHLPPWPFHYSTRLSPLTGPSPLLVSLAPPHPLRCPCEVVCVWA